MKQLIVNADDFGMTRGISDGILDGHRRGIITSTTIMANMPDFSRAAEGARACPNLGVGLHLNLIDGRPVSTQALPGLVDKEGNFFGSVAALLKQLYSGQVPAGALEAELRAQIEKALSPLPVLTHLDGHKHLHVLPALLPIVLRLAREYGIRCVRYPAEALWPGWRRTIRRSRLRVASQYVTGKLISWACLFVRRQFIYNTVIIPDHFFGVTHTGLLDRDVLTSLLCSLPDGVSELMCHPGYDGASLDGHRTRLRAQREIELDALMDPELPGLLRRQSVARIHYGDLARAQALGSRHRA